MKSEPLSDLTAKVAPLHTALLVVDFQNDFVSPDGGLARQGADLEPIRASVIRTACLLERAREAGVKVIFICHINSEETSSAPLREKRHDLGRDAIPVCWKGTWVPRYVRN